MTNKFRLYKHKNSLSKKHSRMLNLGETEIKGNKIGWWEREVLQKNPSTDITITLNSEFHKRPHMVSYRYYNTPSLFWLVLLYNNIVDVEEEFTKGTEITIPNKSRALSEMSGSSPRRGVFDE